MSVEIMLNTFSKNQQKSKDIECKDKHNHYFWSCHGNKKCITYGVVLDSC